MIKEVNAAASSLMPLAQTTRRAGGISTDIEG